MSPRPGSRFMLREPLLGVDLAAFARLPRYLDDFAPRLRTLQAAGCQAVILPWPGAPDDESVLVRNDASCQAVALVGGIAGIGGALDAAFAWNAKFVVVDSPEIALVDDDAVVSEFSNRLASAVPLASARGIQILIRNRPGDTVGESGGCRLARLLGTSLSAGYCLDVYALWGDGTEWDLFVAERSTMIFLVEFRDEWDGVPVALGTGDLPFLEFTATLDRISALHGIHFTASRCGSNSLEMAIASLGSIDDAVDR
ncbi:MAG: hypothetical protein ACKO5K_14485 [Armatimonadota bacterium]